MFIYRIQPVDWWDGATMADAVTTARILGMMPEAPRTAFDGVYETRFPHSGQMKEVYFCKADNNGTVYVFTEFDIFKAFEDFELYINNEGRIKKYSNSKKYYIK